jgi:transcriptional regulator with XRE-family HTH domain
MYGEVMAMSVSEVMGAEARKLRLGAGASLEDVAEAVRSYGLPWSTGRVGDFEAGRAGPDLRTLLVVAAALGDVIGQPVALVDLIAGSGDVAITEAVTVKRSALRAMLGSKPVKMTITATISLNLPKGGKPPQWPKALRGWDDSELHSRVLKELRETDRRMCKRIGVEEFAGAAAMAKLWGKTFVARRDEVAGPNASPQRRGQVSRQLQAELRELIG